MKAACVAQHAAGTISFHCSLERVLAAARAQQQRLPAVAPSLAGHGQSTDCIRGPSATPGSCPCEEHTNGRMWLPRIKAHTHKLVLCEHQGPCTRLPTHKAPSAAGWLASVFWGMRGDPSHQLMSHSTTAHHQPWLMRFITASLKQGNMRCKPQVAMAGACQSIPPKGRVLCLASSGLSRTLCKSRRHATPCMHRGAGQRTPNTVDQSTHGQLTHSPGQHPGDRVTQMTHAAARCYVAM
jgi:hypothetical protein